MLSQRLGSGSFLKADTGSFLLRHVEFRVVQ